MAFLEPQVTWIHGINAKDNEVQSYDFGIVNADDDSGVEVFYLWNNYGGAQDAPKMEDVEITTRDLNGGDGSTSGMKVEAVANNWFKVKVDSLGESSYTPIGKGGVGTINPSGLKALGTNGSTTNKNEATAVQWTASQTWSLGQYVKPTVANGYIYEVTTAGLGDAVEPSWLTTEGLIVSDGTAVLTARKIINTPAAKELLGLANNAQPDGTGVALAAGNFAQFSVIASVPANATTGRNQGNFRVSYRFV